MNLSFKDETQKQILKNDVLLNPNATITDKNTAIEKLIDSAYNSVGKVTQKGQEGDLEDDKELKRLIERRQQLRHKKVLGTSIGQHEILASLSKLIQKKIRQRMRAKRKEKIAFILKRFSVLKEIGRTKTVKKKNRIAYMNNKKGECIRDRQGIANVFADFYEELFARRDHNHGNTEACSTGGSIPKFTLTELEKQLKFMKDGKAADDSHSSLK